MFFLNYSGLLFIMLYNVLYLSFDAMDETVVCDHLNESYRAVFSCAGICYPVQGVLTFEVMKPYCLSIWMNAIELYVRLCDTVYYTVQDEQL